jgi:broad specificity phosphatase PhoE
LVRHGESLGNVQSDVFVTQPDWRIPLTELGKDQARETGRKIAEIVGRAPIMLYTSPYARARQTLKEVLAQFDGNEVVGVHDEPRLIEQQFGNFQNVMHRDDLAQQRAPDSLISQVDSIRDAKHQREQFGKFYYRFPDGESGLDVFTRVSSFIPDLYRQRRAVFSARFRPMSTGACAARAGT